jgi:hypothetical protein
MVLDAYGGRSDGRAPRGDRGSVCVDPYSPFVIRRITITRVDGDLYDGVPVRIAAAVEDAEATADEDLEWTRHREPAKSPTAVYSVRIPVDRIDELRQLAAERGVQPTGLIRTWVLAQLDAARSPNDYAQRWERDVRATAEQLRKLLDERPGAPWADAS